MSVDTATEINISFRDALRGSTVREDSPYNAVTIFGERMKIDERDDLTPAVGDGLWAAWKAMLGDLYVGGSAISAISQQEKQASFGYKSPLLKALAPLHTSSSIWWRYFTDELDPKNLTPEAYLGLLFLRDLRGSNLDIHAWEKRGNFDDTLQKAIAIARFGFTYPCDGPLRNASHYRYANRLDVIHLEQKDDESGGINIVLLPHDNTPYDQWSNATTLRQWQTRRMVRDSQGHIFLPGSDKATETTYPIKMLGNWDSTGAWAHQTARVIRSAAILGIPEEAIDTKSFANRKPLTNDEIAFESTKGIAVELAVADFHNPDKTQHLIESTGLAQYLPFYQNGSGRHMVDMFAKGHTELFGTSAIQPLEWGPPKQFTNMSDVGSLIGPYMPIPANKLHLLIPEPEKRETIRSSSAGQTPISQDPSIAGDAKDVFNLLAQEQLAVGNTSEATTLEKAAVMVQKHFLD